MENPQNRTLRIALDAMGGDFAPNNEIQGAVKVFDDPQFPENVEIVLIGKENEIKSALAHVDHKKVRYSIVHADEVITMDDEPTAAIKKKRNSSLYKGFDLLSKNEVDAFVSAGNTGAMLSTATVLLGRIKGVSRPTIGSFFPSQVDSPTIVLDVGANVDVKARYLYEFAVMGNIYMNQMRAIENPRIGLLNVGEEPSKGTELLQQTYQMLAESKMNFIGNVEGKDILNGACDVVVCDGYTGNAILKFAESVFTLIKFKLKEYMNSGLLPKIFLMISKPVLNTLFKGFDYQKYGGVPILGVNGVAIVGHGKSSPLAIQYMIMKAVEQVQKEVNKKIEAELSSNDN